ncbi:hypothetical protein D5S17_27760 [Pseudonocardiaceae bacterium YIM PH 21723]|nr:hypothetical protein D5S17_27760 [Pseudonocardiaceae bacterium YIM PH 21723]
MSTPKPPQPPIRRSAAGAASPFSRSGDTVLAIAAALLGLLLGVVLLVLITVLLAGANLRPAGEWTLLSTIGLVLLTLAALALLSGGVLVLTRVALARSLLLGGPILLLGFTVTTLVAQPDTAPGLWPVPVLGLVVFLLAALPGTKRYLEPRDWSPTHPA